MKNTTVLYVISTLADGEEGILRKIRNKDRRPVRRTLTGAVAAPTVGAGAPISTTPAGMGVVPTTVGVAAASVAAAPMILSVTGVLVFACLCD